MATRLPNAKKRPARDGFRPNRWSVPSMVAFSRESISETDARIPLCQQPSPRAATTKSPVAAQLIAPASTVPPSSTAIIDPQSGTPRT
jgi:hypothetical protein